MFGEKTPPGKEIVMKKKGAPVTEALTVPAAPELPRDEDLKIELDQTNHPNKSSLLRAARVTAFNFAFALSIPEFHRIYESDTKSQILMKATALNSRANAHLTALCLGSCLPTITVPCRCMQGLTCL